MCIDWLDFIIVQKIQIVFIFFSKMPTDVRTSVTHNMVTGSEQNQCFNTPFAPVKLIFSLFVRTDKLKFLNRQNNFLLVSSLVCSVKILLINLAYLV